jgi:diguanylate cyclase (GGDEF)-like protein
MSNGSDRKLNAAIPVLVAASAASAVSLAVGVLWTKLRTSQASAAEERLAMDAATETLRHRNAQLTSLYNVFSEITETLTLRYVVATTVRETQKIMSADMVVLRKREGDQLVVIGAMADGGVEIKGIQPVSIEEDGLTGRAARKGRSIRIDNDAEGTMQRAAVNSATAGSPAAQTGRSPLESGLITPLIVGAKVVGTISCWSRRMAAFDADDQRLLEMMASTVATAIVASEAVATSERRAHVDPLTELPNRRQLNEDLEGVLSELAAKGRKAVVAMADIDHFKRFNDDFGHKMGDVTLQAVSGVLRKAMRDADHIYRYGGEEFVMVFVDADSSEAEMLAERVRVAVEKTHIKTEGQGRATPVTISIGLACLPEHGDDVGELIELADVAMYQSKTHGRNRVTVWAPTIAPVVVPPVSKTEKEELAA